MKLAFYQYERSHPGNPPHVGMCLLLADARAAGHEVDAALVPPGAIPALVEEIGANRPDLVSIDGIFSREAVHAIKSAHPDVPILAGGANALGLALASSVDFAIMGAGRVAFRSFLEAMERGTPGDGVPNAFFRTREGALDHSGRHAPWDLTAELEPFVPEIEWRSLGGPRTRASMEGASIVPEWGCAFRTDALTGPAYRTSTLPERVGTLAAADLTPRAASAIAPLLANTRGCAFCTFRLQPYAPAAVEATVLRASEQARFLSERHGVQSLSVQSEHPFRFAVALGRAISHTAPGVRVLALRTFPKMLAGSPERVLDQVAELVAMGFRIRLQQIGFENFVQSELDHLGKGVRVEENLAAARLLFELDRRHGERVEVFRGHGLILLTPWTRPEDVLENARVIARDAPFLAAGLGLHSRLAFYEPVSPIARLAAAENLLVESPRDYALDFRFADPRTEGMCRLARALEHVLEIEGVPRGAPLARAAILAAARAQREGADRAADVRFREAAADARASLREDRRTWPHLARVETHRV